MDSFDLIISLDLYDEVRAQAGAKHKDVDDTAGVSDALADFQPHGAFKTSGQLDQPGRSTQMQPLAPAHDDIGCDHAESERSLALGVQNELKQ